MTIGGSSGKAPESPDAARGRFPRIPPVRVVADSPICALGGTLPRYGLRGDEDWSGCRESQQCHATPTAPPGGVHWWEGDFALLITKDHCRDSAQRGRLRTWRLNNVVRSGAACIVRLFITGALVLSRVRRGRSDLRLQSGKHTDPTVSREPRVPRRRNATTETAAC